MAKAGDSSLKTAFGEYSKSKRKYQAGHTEKEKVALSDDQLAHCFWVCDKATHPGGECGMPGKEQEREYQ